MIKHLSIHQRGALLLFVCAFFLIEAALTGAPRRYQDDDMSTTLREMRDSIDVIRHEVNNHETEIRMVEERANNQEATIASLRQQVLDANQANKELVKGNVSTTDGKVSSLESTNKGIVADITQLRTHANETATVLTQSKQRISELEKLVEAQNRNIDNLQAALKSVMEALGSQSNTAVASDKMYRVKNGDSLEKIARANNTTVKAIKELNQLANDKIIVGQTLQLP